LSIGPAFDTLSGVRLSWNWSAAIMTTPWLARRRRYGLAAAVLVGSFLITALVAQPATEHGLLGLTAPILSTLVFGLAGNGIALRDPPNRIASGVAVALSTFAFLFALAVFMIGPGVDTKDKGYRTQMISDLLTLRTLEESTLVRTHHFTAAVVFDSTYGVSRPRITLNADSTAFSATDTHVQLPKQVCGIAVGMPNPIDPRKASGDYACK